MRIILLFLITVSMVFLFAACGGSKDKEDYTDRMAKEHEGDSPVSNESVAYSQ